MAPANGTVNITGTYFGDQAEFSCNDGYDMWGQPEMFCLENGTWSEEPPVCVEEAVDFGRRKYKDNKVYCQCLVL